MAPGRFIAIVGPSGVGKDTVMNALCESMDTIRRCRRTITRAPEAGGEDYEAVDEATFCAKVERGEFALWWHAHGLYYGVPASVHRHLAVGQDVIANLSRRALVEASATFDHLTILSITASPDVLAARLAARGREDEADQARRLEQAALTLPDGLPVTEIDNSHSLDMAVRAALRALQPESV